MKNNFTNNDNGARITTPLDAPRRKLSYGGLGCFRGCLRRAAHGFFREAPRPCVYSNIDLDRSRSEDSVHAMTSTNTRCLNKFYHSQTQVSCTLVIRDFSLKSLNTSNTATRAHVLMFRKNPNDMPRGVWAEESKAGLKFDIMTPQQTC